MLAHGASLAMQLSDGIYRPCGRPFLNHLIGTASVLVFFGFELHLVLAGMLHAAFSHGSFDRSDANDALLHKRFDCLGQLAGRVANLARAYDQRGAYYRDVLQGGVNLAILPMNAVNILLLDAANDIDMHLSLEVAAARRGDVPAGPFLDLMRSVCEVVGRPAMAATLAACHRLQPAIPAINFQGIKGSFFLTEDSVVSALRPQHLPG
jgi:hypothetical protein